MNDHDDKIKMVKKTCQNSICSTQQYYLARTIFYQNDISGSYSNFTQKLLTGWLSKQYVWYLPSYISSYIFVNQKIWALLQTKTHFGFTKQAGSVMPSLKVITLNGKPVYANETTKVDTFQKSLKFGLTF